MPPVIRRLQSLPQFLVIDHTRYVLIVLLIIAAVIRLINSSSFAAFGSIFDELFFGFVIDLFGSFTLNLPSILLLLLVLLLPLLVEYHRCSRDDGTSLWKEVSDWYDGVVVVVAVEK